MLNIRYTMGWFLLKFQWNVNHVKFNENYYVNGLFFFWNLNEVLITPNFVELTDNHCDAQSDTEHLGEVLSTRGHSHTRAWIKSDPQYNTKTHSFVTLPFGFGPRMCIGRRFAQLEIETLVTKVS